MPLGNSHPPPASLPFTVPRPKKSPAPPPAAPVTSPLFAEAPAWQAVGPGWRPLFGNFRDLGFSFEWHEFVAREEFDWARSFHPGSVELCLNRAGRGRLSDGQQTVEILPQTCAFYFQGTPPLIASRAPGEEHRFITIEFSAAFLTEHFRRQTDSVHPLVQAVIRGEAGGSMVVPPERLVVTLHQLVEGCGIVPSSPRLRWLNCHRPLIYINSHTTLAPDHTYLDLLASTTSSGTII